MQTVRFEGELTVLSSGAESLRLLQNLYFPPNQRGPWCWYDTLPSRLSASAKGLTKIVMGQRPPALTRTFLLMSFWRMERTSNERKSLQVDGLLADPCISFDIDVPFPVWCRILAPVRIAGRPRRSGEGGEQETGLRFYRSAACRQISN